MEDYYVLNHRLPKFYIRDYGSETTGLLNSIEESFKIWIVEKVISNVARRKVCARYYQFAQWLEENNIFLEELGQASLLQWESENPGTSIDFMEFLTFVKTKCPKLKWAK